MMKVHWLLDGEMFPEYHDELVAEIEKQGHKVRSIKSPTPPYRWDDVRNSYRQSYEPGSCVVALGDIDFVLRIRNDQLWTPGVFANVESFHWSHYAPHFGEYLLNNRYAMLPFGDVYRQRDLLFETFGIKGRLFIRPDSPLKLFTGQVVTRDALEADLEYLAFYEFPPSSLVVVSAPQEIAQEWRFVVANKTVIAGSLYKRAGKSKTTLADDPQALALAQQIASSDWEPDKVWVIDICRTNEGTYRMVEIGGFSFSDLYACDKHHVVKAVSQAALTHWQDAQDRSE